MALLCHTAAKALVAPIETTLRRLLEEYGLDSSRELLTSLSTLRGNLSSFTISCDPPIGFGDLDDLRVLAVVSTDSLESVQKIIEQGEKADIEFKSSMLFDLRRYRNEPSEAFEAFRHEGITWTLMKTIAAFANSGGGTVFVGVEDDANVCGLAEDFAIANAQRSDFDGWDQCLRGQIETKIFDGKAVANYVRAMPFEVNNRIFVRLQVANRANLTFVKKGSGGAELYVRSGTRSVPIEYQDIEKHYSLKRQL